jgi:hypothetical protein
LKQNEEEQPRVTGTATPEEDRKEEEEEEEKREDTYQMIQIYEYTNLRQ